MDQIRTEEQAHVVTVITEIVTDIVINVTDIQTSPWLQITTHPGNYSEDSSDCNNNSSLSVTADRTFIEASTSLPSERWSCRPGFPAERQVCRDPLFTPHVATFFMVAFGFVILSAVVMNILVLVVMAKSNLVRRSSHNVYVASLAFSDLMVVVLECPPVYIQFLLPGRVSEALFNKNNSWVCITTFFFSCFFGTASIMTQLALNIDRYCMIIHPLTTRALARPSKTRAGFILILVWSVAIIPQFGNVFLFHEVRSESYLMTDNAANYFDMHFCLSSKPSEDPVTTHVYTATVFVIFYFSILLTTLGLYVKIVVSLRRTMPFSKSTDDRIFSIYLKKESSHGIRRKPSRRASRNVLRIMGCSVVSYCCCYSIYFYINLYYIYFGFFSNNGFSFMVIANIMGAVNSLINPVLFACFHDEFKRFLRTRNLLCCAQTTDQDRSLSNSSSLKKDSQTVLFGRGSVYRSGSSDKLGNVQTTTNGCVNPLPLTELNISSSQSAAVVVLQETET